MGAGSACPAGLWWEGRGAQWEAVMGDVGEAQKAIFVMPGPSSKPLNQYETHVGRLQSVGYLRAHSVLLSIQLVGYQCILSGL